METFKTLWPLLALVISIAAGAKVGDLISVKTGKKWIGWTVGMLIFVLTFSFFGNHM